MTYPPVRDECAAERLGYLCVPTANWSQLQEAVVRVEGSVTDERMPGVVELEPFPAQPVVLLVVLRGDGRDAERHEVAKLRHRIPVGLDGPRQQPDLARAGRPAINYVPGDLQTHANPHAPSVGRR